MCMQLCIYDITCIYDNIIMFYDKASCIITCPNVKLNVANWQVYIWAGKL